MHPMGLKLNTKVLGKEFEEEPFFKRVFLNNSCKNSYKNNTDNGTVYFIDQNTADSYISRVSISAETNSSADRMYK